MTYNERKRLYIAFRRFIRLEAPSKSIASLLPYDANTYRNFFEKFFVDDMTWDNYGKVWHIDHIVPSILFDKDKISLCWSVENLQASLIADNKLKGSSLGDALIEITNREKHNPKNQNIKQLKSVLEEEIKRVNKSKDHYINLFVF